MLCCSLDVFGGNIMMVVVVIIKKSLFHRRSSAKYEKAREDVSCWNGKDRTTVRAWYGGLTAGVPMEARAEGEWENIRANKRRTDLSAFCLYFPRQRPFDGDDWRLMANAAKFRLFTSMKRYLLLLNGITASASPIASLSDQRQRHHQLYTFRLSHFYNIIHIDN
jgi:hypothetical protein